MFTLKLMVLCGCSYQRCSWISITPMVHLTSRSGGKVAGHTWCQAASSSDAEPVVGNQVVHDYWKCLLVDRSSHRRDGWTRRDGTDYRSWIKIQKMWSIPQHLVEWRGGMSMGLIGVVLGLTTAKEIADEAVEGRVGYLLACCFGWWWQMETNEHRGLCMLWDMRLIWTVGPKSNVNKI